MRRLIKIVLLSAAMFLVGLCFVLGLMKGMEEEDQRRDSVRQERCNAMPWPRPAQCAIYAQAGVE